MQKCFFLDQLFLPVARQRNEIILDGRRMRNWVLHVHSIMMSGEMATCFLAKRKFSYFDRDFQFWAHYKCISWFDLVFLLKWGLSGCDDQFSRKINCPISRSRNFFASTFWQIRNDIIRNRPSRSILVIIDDIFLRYLALRLPSFAFPYHFTLISYANG